MCTAKPVFSRGGGWSSTLADLVSTVLTDTRYCNGYTREISIFAAFVSTNLYYKVTVETLHRLCQTTLEIAHLVMLVFFNYSVKPYAR